MSAHEVLEITLLTLRVGLVAVLIGFLPALLLGYALARARFPGRRLVQACVLLPMVLPPVAIGLLLLQAFGREAPLGRAAEALFGGSILLTWRAAALAAAVMSFPLLVLGAQQGFAAVPARLEQVATSLGAGRWRTFSRITLPLAARGILSGTIFAFARALGEFGATILVAGHIPGETETLALAIYAAIEVFDDERAFLLAAVSVVIALLTTWAAEALLGSRRR